MVGWGLRRGWGAVVGGKTLYSLLSLALSACYWQVTRLVLDRSVVVLLSELAVLVSVANDNTEKIEGICFHQNTANA